MGVGAAIAGSAVVGALSSRSSARAQQSASQSASQAQVQAADRAAEAQLEANRENIAFQREIFDQQREDNAPWREIGAQSLEQLQQGIRNGQFTPGEFRFNFDFQPNLEADPGYRFRLQEGINALDASAAARGRLQSGAQSKAVTRFASDLASQEYGAAHAREVDRYNREFNQAVAEHQMDAGQRGQEFNQLAALANVGQVATSADQQARQQMASNVSQGTLNTGNAIATNAMQTGNALAQNAMNQGQARASAYQGMAGAANQGMQNYLLYSMLG